MADSVAGAWESKESSAPTVCPHDGPDSEKQLEAAQDPTDNDPPNGGYGWMMVISILLLNAATWGFNTSFGVYLSYFEANDTFPGATPLKYSLVGSSSIAVALLCAPLANFLTKHFGHRVPMLAGALSCSLGQCMAGLCKNFETYIVCQGLIFGVGLGLTLVPSQPLLAQWFDRRLSLAQGLANAGSGLGGLIFSNTTRLLIERTSVKYSLIVNGVISAGILFPCILLMKPRTKEFGALSEPLQLSWMVHRGFIWVWIWGGLAMMSYYVALYSIAIFATNGLGFSQAQGAMIQSLLAAGLMIGRPIAGFVLDKFGRVNMAIALCLANGIACWAVWLPSRSIASLAAFALIQGGAGGAVWSAAAPVAASTVGVKNLGSAMAVFWLSLIVPCFAGNPLAVLLQEYSLSNLGKSGADAYAISIGFCGALSAAAGFCLYGTKWYLQGHAKLFHKV